MDENCVLHCVFFLFQQVLVNSGLTHSPSTDDAELKKIAELPCEDAAPATAKEDRFLPPPNPVEMAVEKVASTTESAMIMSVADTATGQMKMHVYRMASLFPGCCLTAPSRWWGGASFFSLLAALTTPPRLRIYLSCNFSDTERPQRKKFKNANSQSILAHPPTLLCTIRHLQVDISSPL